jgi:hypothetical protein
MVVRPTSAGGSGGTRPSLTASLRELGASGGGAAAVTALGRAALWLRLSLRWPRGSGFESLRPCYVLAHSGHPAQAPDCRSHPGGARRAWPVGDEDIAYVDEDVADLAANADLTAAWVVDDHRVPIRAILGIKLTAPRSSNATRRGTFSASNAFFDVSGREPPISHRCASRRSRPRPIRSGRRGRREARFAYDVIGRHGLTLYGLDRPFGPWTRPRGWC